MLTAWAEWCLCFTWPKWDQATDSQTTQNLVQKLIQARAQSRHKRCQQAAPMLLSTFLYARQLVAEPIAQEARSKAAFICWTTKTPQLVCEHQNTVEYQWQVQYGVQGAALGPCLEGEVDQNKSCSSSRETHLQPQGQESGELPAPGCFAGYALRPAGPRWPKLREDERAWLHGQPVGCSATHNT